MMKKRLTWLGFILLIPSLLFNFFLYQKIQNTPSSGILVIEVFDGDTLLLDGKERLRLRQVDAPELSFCGGEQAKKLMVDLAKGKRVVIKEQILDQYGRPMALVYQDGKLLNLEILASGWARYHADQTTQAGILKEVAGKAKEEGKGIFSSLCYQTENLQKPDCLIKGNVDKNSTARKYYFPGCTQYEFTIVEKDLGEDWFCTEDEAQKAGFIRAETCRNKTYH